MGKKNSRFTRFDRFVGISLALHAGLAVLVVVMALLPREKPPLTIASFELVGNPPKGEDGGSSPVPVASAPQPDPVEPAPTTEPTPPEEPDPTSIAVPKPLPTTPPAKPQPPKPDPKPSTPVPTPSEGKQTQGQTASATQGTSGKPGKTGIAGGDTLSLGGGQGLPSPMALWLSRVKYLVERNWRAPPGLAGITEMPEVVFSVERDGRASMARLRKRSGNPTLDRLALRAIQSVDLFPPVPDVWPENKVVVRYVLQYAP